MRAAVKWGVAGVGALAAAWLAAAEPPADPPKDAKAKVEELRKRYAFESIAGRLDYEPAGAEAFAKSDPAPKVTDETLKRLGTAEQQMGALDRWNPRIRSLQLLHSDQAQKFVEQDGFGVSRMLTPPSPLLLELPAAPTIAFETAREAAPAGEKAERTRPASTPKDDQLAAFQQGGVFDFLNPSGFGYVKDRDHVAGFQPHQFRGMPQLPANPDPATAKATEKWAVLRLELVSLLKHDRPVVYVTGAMPRMEDTKEAPTRPLIPFEEKGLKALKAGNDLATETAGDRIRMVGSLRAGKQCLECHQVKRGDLLGAFSWELQRQPVQEARAP